MVTEEMVREIVQRVLDGMPSVSADAVPVEISGRHVHLAQAHVDELFGKGHQLTKKRDISQPGQFLCEERVRLIGPQGVLENVAVLGPVRGSTQVELSATDARQLGLRVPLRMSGDLSGAADLIITSGDKCIAAEGSAIVAKNHIHMTPGDARRFRVADQELVDVRVDGDRPVTFENVTVRVDEKCKLAMHIDIDEANACLCRTGAMGIVRRHGSQCGA